MQENHGDKSPPFADRKLVMVFGGAILLVCGLAIGLWAFPRGSAPKITAAAYTLPDPPDLARCEEWARLSITRPATYERETWQRAGLDGATTAEGPVGSSHVVTLTFWSDSALGNRTRRKASCRFEGGLIPDGARPWLVDFHLDGKVPRAFREAAEAAK